MGAVGIEPRALGADVYPWTLRIVRDASSAEETRRAIINTANGLAGYPSFTPDDKALAYVVRDNSVDNVCAQPLDRRPAYPLTSFKSDEINDFHGSPDGKRLAIVRGRTESNVVFHDVSR